MRYSYRQLFSIPGTIKFSSAALIGRFPAGMIGLSILLPLSKLTGSYTIAGAIAASTMAGMAVCAPFSGRLVDRYGQSHILILFALMNLIWTTLLIGCIQFGAPPIILCITGAFTGASRLSTGTMVRTRWAYVTQSVNLSDHKRALQAAYAFESIMDEVVFISAPIIATLLCTLVHPLAGLLFCLVSFVVGGLALAFQRSTQPIIERVHDKQSSVFSIRGLQVIFIAVLLIGISAGAVEVLIIAHADELGSRPLVGFLLATLSFSSMLAGFWYGSHTFKQLAASLWIRCLGLLCLALIPLTFVTNLAVLTLTLFIAGLFIAPTAISGQVLTQQMLPKSLMNEGMSTIITAMILGMAIGSWLAGLLIDQLGTTIASSLPAIVTALAFIMAIRYAKLLIIPLTSENV